MAPETRGNSATLKSEPIRHADGPNTKWKRKANAKKGGTKNAEFTKLARKCLKMGSVFNYVAIRNWALF